MMINVKVQMEKYDFIIKNKSKGENITLHEMKDMIKKYLNSDFCSAKIKLGRFYLHDMTFHSKVHEKCKENHELFNNEKLLKSVIGIVKSFKINENDISFDIEPVKLMDVFEINFNDYDLDNIRFVCPVFSPFGLTSIKLGIDRKTKKEE